MTTQTTASGWLTWRRATALKGIAAAVATFPVAVWAMFTSWPVDYAALSRTEILVLALKWLPLFGLWQFFMFTRTARLFDTRGAEEVLAGNHAEGEESPQWKTNQRVFTNSTEQLTLFVPTYLALAAVVPAPEAHILPVLCSLWLFGRVCYFVAYKIEPAYRAFGFDYTIFPAILAFAWFVRSVI